MRVIVALLFAAACGGPTTSAPPPAAPCPAAPEPPKIATEADVEALESRFCDCRGDRACLAEVVEDLQTTVAPIMLAAEFDVTVESCGLATGALDDLKALKQRACDCHDATCADAVQADFDAFLEKHRDTKGSQSQAEKVGELAAEMSKCLEAAKQP